MAKLSVIIPIYNVEQYLKQCLDSVINQTFTDMEIILVDDGSPDNCGEICDQYAEKDERIKIIHKKNEGLPAARNDALRMATGEWIAFVDSDDWLELDIYEKAYAAAMKYEPDVLFFNSFRNTETKEIPISLFKEEFVSEDTGYIKSLQAGTMCKYMTETQELGYGFPWDRIFKREFIFANQLLFLKVKAYEDILYAIDTFQYAKKIAFIETRGYHYRFNINSIGNKYTPDRIIIDQEIFNIMFKLAEEYKADRNYYRALYALVIESVYVAKNRCFFNKQNKSSFCKKYLYVKNVLEQEPYKTALHNVDRTILTNGSKIFTITRHHNALILYLLYIGQQIKARLKR